MFVLWGSRRYFRLSSPCSSEVPGRRKRPRTLHEGFGKTDFRPIVGRAGQRLHNAHQSIWALPAEYGSSFLVQSLIYLWKNFTAARRHLVVDFLFKMSLDNHQMLRDVANAHRRCCGVVAWLRPGSESLSKLLRPPRMLVP